MDEWTGQCESSGCWTPRGALVVDVFSPGLSRGACAAEFLAVLSGLVWLRTRVCLA